MSSWWKIWWVILAIKLGLGALLPLTPDEAYYWIWSQHPSLSYFDHPPAVAWLMSLGDLLPAWGVRWPAIILTHFSLWFWSQLFKRFLSPIAELWWLILVSLMPLTGLGSLIVTPDLPLMFTWSFSLWALVEVLASHGRMSKALMLGLALGLGMLSKYHIVLLGPIGLVLWWTWPARPALWRWLPVSLTLALVVSSPVWIWNIQHDWASFRFQLDHGLGRPSWKLSWTRDYILAQVGLLFPVIVALAAQSRIYIGYRFAAWFPLIFFFATSFRGYVEANWPIVAHPFVLALALTQWPRARSWLKWTAGIWFTVSTTVLFLAFQPHWPTWIEKTKLRDLRQFDALSQATQDLTPLYARSYQMASILSFQQQRPVYKLRGMNRRDFFDSLEESLPKENRFFLILENEDILPAEWQNWTKQNIIQVSERFQILELIRP